MDSMGDIVDLFRIEQAIQRTKLLHQYAEALVLYDQAIQIKGRLSNRLGLVKTAIEKALLLEQIGHIQEAGQIYQWAQEMTQSTATQDFQSFINERLGILQQGLLSRVP